MFRIKQYRKQYIKELAQFIDTIPFVFDVYCVNKNNLLKQAPLNVIKNPNQTTINKAFSIWLAKNKEKQCSDFKTKSVDEILSIISGFQIRNINNYYPLEITFKNLIKGYFDNYVNLFCQKIKSVDICFETSPNHIKVIEIFEKLKNEIDSAGEKTELSINEILAGKLDHC